MSELQVSQRIVIEITLFATILISVWPMSLSPYWNGSLKAFADKQQYDRMGDALLQGHLYIDNGEIDPALKKMENPYDKNERDRLGVVYHWDEAYYNNHYYMYFGVVPTIVLFIPFKLLTGSALQSFQATQIFTVFTIIGLFYLFYFLCRQFFKKFPFSLYLLLCSSFSILSIGYSIAAPALYCTAIVSGVCFMVWSIICFLKGGWIETENNVKSGLFLFLGSFLGALAFGCRPPVALANIISIAVINQILKMQDLVYKEKIAKIALIIFPYVVVGVVLMIYNYARFDNVFEFGQSYQLTITDQHNYGNFVERFNIRSLLAGIFVNFCLMNGFNEKFPYISHNGVFITFPILLSSFMLFTSNVVLTLQRKKLYFMSLILFCIPFVVTLFDVYWSPVLIQRYHLDFYYILCITCFVVIAAWFENISANKKKWLLCILTVLSFGVLSVAFLQFCIPYDGSFTDFYPEVLDTIYQGLRFGL